jgi:hypothetical protein
MKKYILSKINEKETHNREIKEDTTHLKKELDKR